MSELLEFTCPSCGGAMEFDSALQKMKCPYCDTTVEMAEMQSKDEAFDEPQESAAWEYTNNGWDDGERDHMSVFSCNTCGGEIIGDENTSATTCPYCGNHVVMTGRFQGKLKPDVVIPFRLDKEAAKARYHQHISGKFLLPKQFRDENHIDEIKGIYVPFWLYDSSISANAHYSAERVRHWSDRKYNYTETSIFDVYRQGNMAFRNIPCDGSSKMDDDLMESIEPFDFSKAVPFQSAYLAGYFADKYDVDEMENEDRANNRILNSAVDVFEDTFRVFYTSVQRGPAHMNVLEGSVKYALYPVWLLSSTYKGEKYTFAMNGQTGKFVGDLPVDKAKRNLTFAGVFAAASAIATFLASFFMG